jgi:hypothetical protein
VSSASENAFAAFSHWLLAANWFPSFTVSLTPDRLGELIVIIDCISLLGESVHTSDHERKASSVPTSRSVNYSLAWQSIAH